MLYISSCWLLRLIPAAADMSQIVGFVGHEVTGACAKWNGQRMKTWFRWMLFSPYLCGSIKTVWHACKSSSNGNQSLKLDSYLTCWSTGNISWCIICSIVVCGTFTYRCPGVLVVFWCLLSNGIHIVSIDWHYFDILNLWFLDLLFQHKFRVIAQIFTNSRSFFLSTNTHYSWSKNWFHACHVAK